MGADMRLFFVLSLSLVVFTLAALPPADEKADLATLAAIHREEMRNYRSWPLFPGTTALAPGEGPHGDFITTRLNDIALKAVREGAPSMPDGSIVTKENYIATKEYRSTVVMKKIRGRWFWGLLKPDGVPRSAGSGLGGSRLKTCLECHQKANRDQLYVWKDPAR
jgi:hypothetical protein